MLSPVEVMRTLMEASIDHDVVSNFIIGPVSEKDQMTAAVQIMDAGQGAEELYLPLIRPRFQLRCVAPDLGRCEIIGRTVQYTLDALPARVVVPQPSSGESFLVHYVNVTGGPSAHRDSEGTWEYLVFADTMMDQRPA